MMEPQAGNPNEIEGVLNPAAIRARKDGQLYLFPRLVARGNYSRIGIARVLFDRAGDPMGVERMGMALEPEADYELSGNGGGCEDPRIAYVEPLQHYVMTYTALSRHGPRIAIAISDDLLHWRRIGLANFHPYNGIAFDGVDDKDASMFPARIPGPVGQPAIALVHRPLFPGHASGRKIAPIGVPHHGYSSRKHLDLVLPRGRERRGASPRRVHRTSTIGLPRGGVGTPQNRWRRTTHHVPPWLADDLSRRTRPPRTGPSRSQNVLFRRRAGALEGASEQDYLSLVGTGARSCRIHWSATEQSTMSCFPRVSIVATILARRTASTSITAWRTSGSAWRG